LKIPVSSTLVDTVQSFYSALLTECGEAGYNSHELSLLRDKRCYYGRYLDANLRSYFIHTTIPHIALAIGYFQLSELANQAILDLGCGLGMQSIIFASLGAKVVGADIREEAISLCKKRKAYYERRLNVDLDIEFRHCDFRTSRQSDFGIAFDALFSMSAFSYMRPLEATVELVSTLLRDNATVFLYEENASCLASAARRRAGIPTPKAIVNAFTSENFETDFLYGGCSLPSLFWRIQQLNGLLVLPLNNALRKSLYMSFNYVLGMKRTSVQNAETTA
jgi:2-polyprenyl-3-methyl-5-hydroxy-6-metoxy-1,4-benzoquinol methylase